MLRADLLRYMLLESEGGIYSDLSTIGIKPVSEWIPPNLASKIHAIIAIEHDNREDIEDPYPDIQAPRLHFSQRIIATSRGHPLMSHMITNVMDALQALAVDKNATTIAELRPTDDEVVRVSGEGVWTRAVLKTLGERMGEEMGMGNSTGMRGPRVFGDVLVLPVGGFGRGGEGEGVVRYGWERRGRRGWGD